MAKIVNTKYHDDAEKSYRYITNELNHAQECGIFSKNDTNTLQKYQIKLEKTCCPRRIHSIILALIAARRFFKVEFQEVDGDEYEEAFSRILRGNMVNTTDLKYAKPYSRNYIVTIQKEVKRLFQWMSEKNLTKVSEKIIGETVVGKYDMYTKNENDVLTADDINAIISAAPSPMYKALFAMLYETGARSIEMANLKWSDLVFQDWGIQVRITDTKTDKIRAVPCIIYAKYLYEWANNYNDGEPTGDKFVFLSVQKKPIQYNTIKLELARLVKKAGIEKKVTLHRFRHSRITHMLREGMSETVAKKAFWGNLDSHMIATYGHLTNADIEDACLQMAGVEVPNRKRNEAPKPITCPTCHKVNPPKTRYCPKCGTPLSAAAKKKSQNTEEYLDSKIPELSAGDFMAFKEIVAELTKMKKELDQLKAQQKNGK